MIKQKKIQVSYKIKKHILENLIRQIVAGILSESKKNNLKLSVYPKNYKSVVNYIRIKKSNIPDEFIVAWYINGKFNDDNSYYTNDLKDAFFTFNTLKKYVDKSNGLMEGDESDAVNDMWAGNEYDDRMINFKNDRRKLKQTSQQSTQKSGKIIVKGKEIDNRKLKEMTTTGAVSGFNIPAAFSKRGGSEAGIAGSEALGYTMTPEGEKEMQRSADKLV